MKIGIIGAGNIGGNLTRRLAALGHDVAVANSRGPQTLTALAEETGAVPVTVAEAARGAEVVVVTIPLKNIRTCPQASSTGRRPASPSSTRGTTTPASATAASPASRTRASPRAAGPRATSGTPSSRPSTAPTPKTSWTGRSTAGHPDRQALPVAGDDEAAKKTVRALIDELGFDSVDSGGIDDSWRQQPGTPVYGLRAGTQAVVKALAEASAERPEDFRG